MSDPIPPIRRARRIPEPLVFALAALAVLSLIYGPYLAGGWVWDDVYLVRDNAALRSFAGLRAVLARDLWGGATGRPTELYHPIPMFTLWAQAQLGSVAIVPMRAFNVVIHALCATALFALMRRRGIGVLAAWIAAGVFLLHPSAAEPVQWITGRHDTLGVLCVLGAMLFIPPGVSAAARAWAGCAALCAFAFLCKEPYVVAPVVVLAFRLLEGPPAPRDSPALRALPFAGILAVFALRAALGIPGGSAQLGAPPTEHLRNYASIVAHYFGQIALARNGPTIATYAPLSAAASALCLILVAIATVVLAWFGRSHARARGAFAGWLWFLVALAPHVVSLPVIGQWGNRYAYFPAAGLCFALAFGLDALVARQARAGRSALAAAGAACAIALGARSAGEAAGWRDDVTLYSRDVARDEHDGRARYHYAVALQRRSGCATAAPEFARATRDAPDYPRAWHNLAGCLINLGRFAEAVGPARNDVRLAPENARAWSNLGVALVMAGSYDEGAAALTRALALEPVYRPAREVLEIARARSAATPGGPAPPPRGGP